MANSRFPVIAAAKSGVANLIKAAFAGRIPFIPSWQWTYRVQCQIVVVNGAAVLRCSSNLGGGGYTDVALTAGVGPQEIDLQTASPRLLFPANVDIQRGACVKVRTNTAGLTTCTITLGDTGDPDGLLTATNLHTGTADRVVRTPAAAEFDVHEEAAFIPVIRLTSPIR